MAKRIRFKNNAYLDSSSIVHNNKSLNNILNMYSIKKIRIGTNPNYVATTDFTYECFKIGNMCILQIQTIAFIANIENKAQFITGLPKPKQYTIFPLYGHRSSSGKTLRCAISAVDGGIQTHYSDGADIGSAADNQYSGIVIYETV